MNGSNRARSARPPLSVTGRSASSRPGPPSRAPSRAVSVMPTVSTRSVPSPTNSVASMPLSRNRSPNGQVAGTKRKERDFESDAAMSTNINVVVRCRGRNEREVRENSGVVVKTEQTVSESVELSMGPSALSNKTYHFDKVFSPAASQGIVYEEVVAPILDQVLQGFNCTIFAYGQTGTGKTYTMSGDMLDSLGLLSDSAGIIPRVLNALFRRLDSEETQESSVKCSFIELYNEELRDLIALDENAKLKIFDQEKKGHTTTVVQGMEEAHIRSAEQGISLLQTGSHRRQVAATKCNDLSSRSHTVFTVTVYLKRTLESGEEFVSTGKLNLVDLAGSENIQRSGAENKRATEAGLINKSLLTLGRVINALVDRGSHIPYRESKLTRLLQDSLGGRTKTCIIATISPAKSNLEETMSTLDYAFRAKNIKNKPQINQLMSKHTLLREFTAEIQQLKSELIMTRQRNGVYLTNEAYEEMTIESESRRILSEEQRAKLEIMEASLRNKIQELFDMTNNFASLKKDNEATRKALAETGDILTKTEIVLQDTRQNLADETLLRKAHQATENELNAKGQVLISTLDRTVKDVSGLHAKLRRRSDLQSTNRSNWQASTNEVSNVTELVEGQVASFQNSQRYFINKLSERVGLFVEGELKAFEDQKAAITMSTSQLETLEAQVGGQASSSRTEMNQVLEEIKVLREDVKDKVGEGLRGLSAAAGRISAGIISELGQFHDQLHCSYSSLGEEFRSTFETLNKQLVAQKADANRLRNELALATEAAAKRNQELSAKFEALLEEEKQQAAKDRASLLSQITSLVSADANAQEQRWEQKMDAVKSDMQVSQTASKQELEICQSWLACWNEKESHLQGKLMQSRDVIRAKLKDDWNEVDERHASIQTTTKSVHEETVSIVDQQMTDIATQMASLDDFVTRAKLQNESHHTAHLDSLHHLATNVANAFGNATSAIDERISAISSFNTETGQETSTIASTLDDLDASARQPLSNLRNIILAVPITEYTPTGSTPQKQQYTYPTTLPTTAAHEDVLARSRPARMVAPDVLEGLPASAPTSPSKAHVYPDATPSATAPGRATVSPLFSRSKASGNSDDHTVGSLREIDANIACAPPLLRGNSAETAKGHAIVTVAAEMLSRSMGPPPLKRVATESAVVLGKGKTNGRRAEGRENQPLSQSVGTGTRRMLRSSTRH